MVRTSNAAKHSSKRSILGSEIKAIAITNFFFCPPESKFALIPDIPESLEPIVEKANTFDNLSQSNDINKSDLINNSNESIKLAINDFRNSYLKHFHKYQRKNNQ